MAKIEKYVVERFESVAQFERALSSRKIIWEDEYCTSGKESDSVTAKCGTASYAQANELLLHGDKSATRDTIFKDLQAIKQKIQKDCKRRALYSDVCGCAPNVPAYIAGCPKSMINTRQTIGKQKVITIVYNSSVGWSTGAETIRNANTQFLGALLALEAGGARIELYLNFGSKNYIRNEPHTANFFIKLKSAGQYIDVAKLIYPLTNPSFMRRHFFRWMEQKNLAKKTRDNYGYVQSECKPQVLADAKIKADRVISFNQITDKDYKQIAQMIDCGA